MFIYQHACSIKKHLSLTSHMYRKNHVHIFFWHLPPLDGGVIKSTVCTGFWEDCDVTVEVVVDDNVTVEVVVVVVDVAVAVEVVVDAAVDVEVLADGTVVVEVVVGGVVVVEVVVGGVVFVDVLVDVDFDEAA